MYNVPRVEKYGDLLKITQLFMKEPLLLKHFTVCIITNYVCIFSRVQLSATPWTVNVQAPLSMGFSRQEYWSELPFPSPGDLPDPGIKPGSPTLQGDSLLSEPPGN